MLYRLRIERVVIGYRQRLRISVPSGLGALVVGRSSTVGLKRNTACRFLSVTTTLTKQEEDATRRRLPRDEAPQALRETFGEDGPGEGGSRSSRPQARPQKITVRRSATDEGSGGPRDCRKGPPRSLAPFLILE